MQNWANSNQYIMFFSNQKYRRRFTKEEDEKLLNLIDTYENKDFINWSRVASRMSNRTARQCRERYLNYLVEKTKKGDWSQDEDDLILALYEKMGPKWAKMTTFFDKRSNIDLKNRYSTLTRRFQGQPSKKSSTDVTNYYQQNVDQSVNSIGYTSPNPINYNIVQTEYQPLVIDDYHIALRPITNVPVLYQFV